MNLLATPQLAIAVVIFLLATVFREPPSLLSKRLRCPAYIAAPMEKELRAKFQGMHAVAMIRVIVRHLRRGFNLVGAEITGKGFKFDLLFRLLPSGKTRLVEVKSSRQIKESHKIQAALYRQFSNADEIVVSNRETDEILTGDFIKDVLAKAKDLYAMDPTVAATTFTPHADCCSTCANMKCPYRRDGLA